MAAEQVTRVGVVDRLMIFAVKSMRGIHVREAQLGFHGFTGDRRYGFVQTGSLDGLPWVTAREVPTLVTFDATFDDPNDRTSSITVTAPDGRAWPVTSHELIKELTALLGADVHLMRLDRGAFDALPVSLITDRSINAIASGIDPARFRPNIVVDTTEDREFPEGEWVGRSLVFGESGDRPRLRVNARDQRCKIVNLDPQTGVPDRSILEAVARKNRNLLGVYGSTEQPGVIRVGDPVYLIDQ